MTNIPSLIARIEALKPGDDTRKLADEVLLVSGWQKDWSSLRDAWFYTPPYFPCSIDFSVDDRPNPLESIDAAVQFAINAFGNVPAALGALYHVLGEGQFDQSVEQVCAALTIAALLAKEAGG